MAKPRPTKAEILKALQCLTTSVELAGAAFGLARNASYESAKQGAIAGCPVIRQGGKLIVPTAPIRKRLGLEELAA